MTTNNLTILKKLKHGNAEYVERDQHTGNVSSAVRLKTAIEGQHPYAIVIACSDSREIPETIFNVGIGELFVIRVTGNVLDNHQLGSIEYAASHLDANLIVMLGHTKCGAVGATIQSHGGTDSISVTSWKISARRSEMRQMIIRRRCSMWNMVCA